MCEREAHLPSSWASPHCEEQPSSPPNRSRALGPTRRGDVTQAERASLKVRFEMGTSLSHLRLLMRMLVEDWEMMLVMEDDALVAPSFYRDLSLRMCRLPDNWDALQLFDCSNPRREAVGYTVANGLRLYKGGVCLAVRPAHARGHHGLCLWSV